jgi:hypothetical protein
MSVTIASLIEEELRRLDWMGAGKLEPMYKKYLEMVDKLELMWSDDEELRIEGDEIDMGVDDIPGMRKALHCKWYVGDITVDEVISFWWVELNAKKILMDKNIKCLTNLAHNFWRENGEEAFESISSNILGSYLHLQKIAREIEYAEELVRLEEELVMERINRDMLREV